MSVTAKAGPLKQEFQFGQWCVTSTKDHILESDGPERQRFETELKLPQLPEMIFANNKLRLVHTDGFGIEFNALDALRLVDAEHDLMKVAVADAWREARADCEHINHIAKPYDWTYSSNYTGTLLGEEDSKLQVTETTERIDLEKLKVKEKIYFYEDLLLFEDELSDNGSSMLSVKIRVMPSSFFILQRFYLRVDNLLIRENDTRIYHEGGKNYILREFTCKEKPFTEIKAPLHIIIDPAEVSNFLDLKEYRFEKLEFPKVSCTQAAEVPR
ncbi:TIP41-like protein isoform X1 [Lingula anatina]|nr:TIP41-like protein isoform X1 [Lingula anatina]|eukprot:XP_013380103.1 TIP41-like protein isoform X1 [Lingula anatina]